MNGQHAPVTHVSQQHSQHERRRVRLVDPSVFGQSHLLVNLGMIELCGQLFDEVEVIAERSHCEALARYGATIDRRVTLVPYDSRGHLASQLRRTLGDSTTLVFLNLEFWLFVQVASRRPVRQAQITWVLHSHFASDDVRRWWPRTKQRLKALLLFRTSRGMTFIVYGSRIRSNLLTRLGRLASPSQIWAVTHPLGIRPSDHRGDSRGSRSLRIVHLAGWHPLSPRSRALLMQLSEVAAVSTALTVDSVGSSLERRADGVKVVGSDYRERLGHLADADLVLQLPGNDYSLQASGALMDAFVTGVPVVGPTTDFQREIEQLVGPVGFFFDTDEELVAFVQSLDHDPGAGRKIAERRKNLHDGFDVVMTAAEVQLSRVLRARSRSSPLP